MISSRPTSKSLLLTVLVPALAGQIFLAQSQVPWTLWVGLPLAAAALWKLRKIPAPPFVPTSPLKGEWAISAFIFLLAACAHFWRIDIFPAGLHTDLGEIGWCALRILHEGWRPLEEAFQYQTPFLTDFYQLAAWFSMAGSSLFSIHLFFILMSLATLPLLYLFFRRLAGPVTALTALFFMAVMRWQWIEARNPHPSCEAPLYVLAVAALLLVGFENRKPLYLAGAALVAGLGLYAYQSLKALPFLILALTLFEYFRFPKERKHHQIALLGSGLLLLVMALPLLQYFLNQNSFGKRESEVFILPALLAQKSPMPLLRSIAGTALMFNRQGDMDPFHNLPGHRMLDDLTGILFWIGLAMAWRWRKERQGAYPLIGLGVMVLPGLLTTEWWASQRYTGSLPFVAYFAAVGAVGLWKAAAPGLRNQRWILWPFTGVFLCTVAIQNSWTYFGVEANDLRCQEAAGLEQTFIGEEIARLEKQAPGRFRYFIDPFFEHNPTVAFLGYSASEWTTPFVGSDWAQGKMPRDKDSMVYLAQDKSAVWFLLQNLFPHVKGDIFRGADQKADLYWGLLPVSDLKGMKAWKRGLQGRYFQSIDWTGSPIASRVDPVINFSSREDFPFTGPFPYRARWSGRLEIKLPGSYEFVLVSTDPTQFWLDGRDVAPEKPVLLSRGFHSLRLELAKDDGYYMVLHLLWKKPDGTLEIVPAEAFGVLP